MIFWLELKQELVNLFSKYEMIITHVGKFLLAFICLLMINGQLGYMSALNNILIVLMAALLCSILPVGFTVVMSAAFVIGHLHALSDECMLVGLLLFLIMFLLYYRFSPKDTVAIMLLPICFVLKIPYVVPIALGLLAGPASVITIVFGLLTAYFLQYISQNALTLGSMAGSDETVSRYQTIITNILGNETMWVMVGAFCITLLVVYFIRRTSMDYSWQIAIVAGVLTNMMCLLIGDLVYSTDNSIIGVILGNVLAALIAMVIQLFAFNLNYSRVEKVQFEDDEYYYYVKAVPKNTVATRENKVKKINRSQEQKSKRN